MSRSILIAVLLFGLFAIVQCNVHIRRFGDPETTTNQYLVWDDDNTYVLVDAGFGLLNNTEALIGNITEIGANRTTLRMIFLTHSHPDHFGGVPILALSFPNTPIVVADRETKNEIIVAAAANFPDIEYNWGSIQIYNTRFEDIFNEVSIKPVTGLPRAESERYVMLLNRDYNWIITGDVLNARSHAYLGETVDIQSLRNWYVIALGTLDVGGVLGLDQFTIYYPGRGLATAQDEIQEQIEYLQTFEQLVAQCSNIGQPFYSLSDVRSEMADRYPKYLQRNLLNEMPKNPNWVQFQASLNCTVDEVNHSSVLYAPFFVVAALCFMLL